MFALIILLKICFSNVIDHAGISIPSIFLIFFLVTEEAFIRKMLIFFLIFLPSLSPWVTDIPANKSNPPTRSQLEINVLFFTVFFIYLLAQQQYSTHRTVLWMFAITFTIYVLLTLISGALDFKLQLWFKTILHHDALR